jgi:hypothetical protein
MKMALPPFIPTLRSHSMGNHTRVDNLFCMEDLIDAIIKCNTDDANRPVKTDHYPIVTQLNIFAPKQAWKPRCNFRMTTWSEFVETLKENLTNIPPLTEINNIEEFDDRLNSLNEAVQITLKKHIKLTKPSPYLKRWWTMELMNTKRKTRQLARKGRQHCHNNHHPIHKEYRQQHNQYAELLRMTKTEHWAEWLEGLDESSVWQASKIMTTPSSDASKSRIPTLMVRDPVTKRVTWQATDNESKGKWFYKLFFPPTDPSITLIPPNYRYPLPRWSSTNITDKQIH